MLHFRSTEKMGRDQQRYTCPSPLQKRNSFVLSTSTCDSTEATHLESSSASRKTRHQPFVAPSFISPNGHPVGAAVYDVAQQESSPLSTPTSTKKLPFRKSLYVIVQAPLLSTPKKKKSTRRKKAGGLAAFLSKYDGKEQNAEPISCSASYTGSISSCSASSKGGSISMKSITSMPARLPKMFTNRSFFKSDTKETTSANDYTTSSLKGPKRDSGKTEYFQDTSSSQSKTHPQSFLGTSQHRASKLIQKESSLSPKKCLRRCLSYDCYVTKPTPKDESNNLSPNNQRPGGTVMATAPLTPKALQKDDSSLLSPKTYLPLKCASYHGYVPNTPKKDESSYLSHHSYHGSGWTPTVSPIFSSPRVRPVLNRGGLVPTVPCRRNNFNNFGIDQYLGDKVADSYEQLLSEFNDSSRSFEVDGSLVLSDVPLSARSSTERAKVSAKQLLLGPPPLLAGNCSSLAASDSTDEGLLPMVSLNRVTSEDSITLVAAIQSPTPRENRRVVNRRPSTTTADAMIEQYMNILKDFDDSSDMDKLLAYASCNSLPVEDLLLLNSCKSLDVSNKNLVIDGQDESCSSMDVNRLLDDKIDCSNVMKDASSNNVLCKGRTTATNSSTGQSTTHNKGTTARPVPAAFRKPRTAVPSRTSGKNDGPDSGAVAISTSTPGQECTMKCKVNPNLNVDHDDDNVDLSINTCMRPIHIESATTSSATTTTTTTAIATGTSTTTLEASFSSSFIVQSSSSRKLEPKRLESSSTTTLDTAASSMSSMYSISSQHSSSRSNMRLSTPSLCWTEEDERNNEEGDHDNGHCHQHGCQYDFDDEHHDKLLL